MIAIQSTSPGSLPVESPFASAFNTSTKTSSDQGESRASYTSLLAKAIVRNPTIPDATLQFLFGRSQPQPASRVDTFGSVKLIEELLHSAGVNDAQVRTRSHELELTLCQNLSETLHQFAKASSQMDSQVQAHWILQALMPLYLAAGEGELGSGLVDVLQGLRHLCSLFELNRILDDNELMCWLAEQEHAAEPQSAIEKVFQVSIPDLTLGLWSEMHRSSDRFSFTLKTPRKHNDLRKECELRHAQWQLVTQFISGSSPIQVPAEATIGNVAWDKLIEHWRQLEQAIAGNRMKSMCPLKGLHDGSSSTNSKINGKPEEPTKPIADSRFIEIRSAKDPQLSSNLDQLLNRARSEQSTLSIVVLKKLDCIVASGQHPSAMLQNWQSKFIRLMDQQAGAITVRGFVSADGDLSLVYEDVERTELAQWTRESFSHLGGVVRETNLATSIAIPLAAGIASVVAPSKSFKIDQLIQSAWRCLDGAANQGAGAVKTIEVY